MSAPSSSSLTDGLFASPLPRAEPREKYLWNYFHRLAAGSTESFRHLAVHRSSTKGRYLTTNQSHSIGSILFTESSVLSVSDDPSVCLACGVRHSPGTKVSCPTFAAIFLPMRVTLAAAESIASQTGYTVARIRGVMKWIGLTQHACFTPLRGAAARSTTEERRKEQCDAWTILGLDDGSVTTETVAPSTSSDSSSPPAISYETIPRRSDPDRTLATDLIHQALPLTWKKTYTKEMIETVLNVLDLNAHETSEIVLADGDGVDDSSTGVDGTPGDAVFPFFAMIEHSCVENCAWTVTGNRMQISAMREIRVENGESSSPSSSTSSPSASMNFDFTHALVRGLSPAFEQSLQQHPPPEPIDMKLAHEQHQRYIDVLHSLVSVIEVPADAALPDCNFIEDTALILNDSLVLSHPGAVTRRGEVIGVDSALRTHEFAFRRRLQLASPCLLDGGDVLFTGRHLFVGISSRTNMEACQQLSAWFAGPTSAESANRSAFTVHPIPVTDGLHLKSILSILADRVLVIDSSPAASKMRDVISSIDPSYRFVVVPDKEASNVLRVKDTLLIQDGFPQSELILRKAAEEFKLKVVTLKMSELIKADGALTCGSLLSTIGPQASSSSSASSSASSPLSSSAECCLSINYGHAYQPTSKRRAYLESSYGFRCTCPLCVGDLPDTSRAFRCPTSKCPGLVSPLGETNIEIDHTRGWAPCTVCANRPTKEAILNFITGESQAFSHLRRRHAAASFTDDTILDGLIEESDLLRSVRPEIEQIVEAVLTANAAVQASSSSSASQQLTSITSSSSSNSNSSSSASGSSSSSSLSFSSTPNRSKTARKLASQRRKVSGGSGAATNNVKASLAEVSAPLVPLSASLRASIQTLAPSHWLIHQLLEMLLCLVLNDGDHSASSVEARPHYDRALSIGRLRVANIMTVCGRNHWSLAREYDRMGAVTVMAGEPTTAMQYWKLAYEVHRTLFGDSADSTRRAKQRVDRPPQTIEQL